MHGALREEAQLLASVGTVSRHSVCFQVVLISSAWMCGALCCSELHYVTGVEVHRVCCGAV